jgi:excisionase family DNA binding protein
MPRTSRRLWPILLSVSEAAQALGVHRTEIYAAIASGALPCFQHGVKRRILTESLVAWIKRTWKQVGVPNARD